MNHFSGGEVDIQVGIRQFVVLGVIVLALSFSLLYFLRDRGTIVFSPENEVGPFNAIISYEAYSCQGKLELKDFIDAKNGLANEEKILEMEIRKKQIKETMDGECQEKGCTAEITDTNLKFDCVERTAQVILVQKGRCNC